MHQSGRLQRMCGALISQIAPGQSAQFRIDVGHQAVSRLIPAASSCNMSVTGESIRTPKSLPEKWRRRAGFGNFGLC